MHIHWFDRRQAFEQATQLIARARGPIEAEIATRTSLHGWCAACEALVDFEVRSRPSEWTDLREAIVCPQCGLNGRMRLIVNALNELGDTTAGRFHILERCTPLFVVLSARYPNLTGSEFLGPDHAPGSQHRLKGLEGIEIEHQDFMNLSFLSHSLDLLAHGDVLEHVPDPQAALREAARALKGGGTMLFTVPFFAAGQHRTRARLENGTLHHIEPPAYHGNPMMPDKGSLVFTDPSWQLLDDMLRAGFQRVEIGLCYDPFQGIVANNNGYPEGFMWPVIFRARR